MLDKDDTVAVILLSYDYSKAFDSVSPNLIKTLENKEFPEHLVAFIRSYLSHIKCQKSFLNQWLLSFGHPSVVRIVVLLITRGILSSFLI